MTKHGNRKSSTSSTSDKSSCAASTVKKAQPQKKKNKLKPKLRQKQIMNKSESYEKMMQLEQECKYLKCARECSFTKSIVIIRPDTATTTSKACHTGNGNDFSNTTVEASSQQDLNEELKQKESPNLLKRENDFDVSSSPGRSAWVKTDESKKSKKKKRWSAAEKRERKASSTSNYPSIVQTTCLLPDPNTLNNDQVITKPSRLENGKNESTSSSSLHHPPLVNKIYVKPLLVLDLNGILCHRIRYEDVPELLLKQQQQKRQYEHSQVSSILHLYRRPIARVAGTPVVPRTDLKAFLRLLDESFTLAIWTSAKKKTAKVMVDALIPTDIKDRLLFIWAQNRCDSVTPTEQPQDEGKKDNSSVDADVAEALQEYYARSNSITTTKVEPARNYRKVIFQKRISKVWDAYPLWNQNNTLLMDDSPDKCPEEYNGNTVHPPPIVGLNATTVNWIKNDGEFQRRQSRQHDDGCLLETYSDDKSNEMKQVEFFKNLINCWNSTTDEGFFMKSHLSEFGRDHMGYRCDDPSFVSINGKNRVLNEFLM